MTFSKSDLMHVARLARLSLRDEEISRLERDLASIVGYVDQLSAVDVDGVEPMAHAGDRVLSFRPDQAFEPLGRDCVKGSEGYEDGLIKVPKIIE